MVVIWTAPDVTGIGIFMGVDNPRYILDLLARIVTVSLETMTIVDALPALDIPAPEEIV